MAPRDASDAPQISLTNWILGGSLVTNTGSSSNRGRRASTLASKKSNLKGPENEGPTKEGEKESPKAEEPAALEGLEIILEDVTKTTSPDGENATVTGDSPKPAAEEKQEDNSGWTAQQDENILRLKAENKSWKEICPVVKASKKEIQKRFKELQAKIGDAASEKGGDNKADGGSDDNPEKAKDDLKKDGHITDGNAEGRAKDTDPESKDDGGESATRGRLKADAIWTKEDCEVLEMLELRYREQKWLQMQAGFYNLTGRMVLADIIKKKFSEE